MTLLPALLITLASITLPVTEDPAMRAEIGIAEKILQELINQADADGGLMTAGAVRGSHIPGYGILFDVNVPLRPRMIRVTRDDRATVVRTASDSLSERLTGQVETYLIRYADLIANVPADAHIAVNIATHGLRGSDRTLVSVRKRDLTERQNGYITEAALRSRIRKDALTASPELDILAKVFETAVNADTSKMFSAGIFRSALLPGYGAMISGEIRTVGSWRLRGAPAAMLEGLDLRGTALPDGVFEFRIDSVAGSARVMEMEARRQLETARQELDRMRIVIGEETALRERSESEIRTAYEALETRLVALLVDYGRTVTQVEGSQSVMVRVAVSRLPDGLPRHLTLTVSKQTLADYDRRAITKAQAMQRVTVVRE